MARKSKFRFRFRKSFTIIPGLLKWTLTKKGASLNFTLGPYSRSWGTRGTHSTLDAPGQYGLSWRKETYRRGAKKEEAPDPQRGERRIRRLCLSVIGLHLLIGLARLYVHPLRDCEREGFPLPMLLLAVGLELAAWSFAWQARWARNLLLVLLLAVGGTWVQWTLFAQWVSPHISCV